MNYPSNSSAMKYDYDIRYFSIFPTSSRLNNRLRYDVKMFGQAFAVRRNARNTYQQFFCVMVTWIDRSYHTIMIDSEKLTTYTYRLRQLSKVPLRELLCRGRGNENGSLLPTKSDSFWTFFLKGGKLCFDIILKENIKTIFTQSNFNYLHSQKS